MLNPILLSAHFLLLSAPQVPPTDVSPTMHMASQVSLDSITPRAAMAEPTAVQTAVPVLDEAMSESPKALDQKPQMPTAAVEIAVVTDRSVSHVLLDSLLQQYVSASGKVDYKGLVAQKDLLNDYCQYLSDHPVEDDWSTSESMAYWINAYNAFTLQLIVNNYPTKSILNFDGGKTWDVKRIKIGAKKYSLNNIENDILRPQFKDARIHFALNCAAKSCPPLWNHAYTAKNLDATLELRARAFVNNPDFNNISTAKASVSKIFDWYGADFGDLKKFLNRYAKQQLKSGATVTFKEYNWDLNGQ